MNSLSVVGERECSGLTTIYTAINIYSGLEPVPRCEPSTYELATAPLIPVNLLFVNDTYNSILDETYIGQITWCFHHTMSPMSGVFRSLVCTVLSAVN